MNIDEPEISTPPETGPETVRIQRWSAPECPFAIDYSTEVLSRIRQRAVEGFHALPHGGLEIGGLLFGRVMPNARNPLRVEIAAERPIECAHAAGPAFVLSEEEIAGIATFLEGSRFDAEIAALSVVGFWTSHSRTHIGLTLDDQDLLKRLFPYPWQIVLIVKPENGAATRATFFFKVNGRVYPHEQRHEFGADGPLKAAAEPREVAPPNDKYQPIALERRGELSAFLTQPAAEVEPIQSSFHLRKVGIWLTIALMVCSALAGGAVAYFLRDFWHAPMTLKGHDPDLNLEIFETGTGMLIHWNTKAVEIQNASRGELIIQEGATTRSLPLNLNLLLQGFLHYTPHGDDVLVNLKVLGRDGAVEQASAHYTASNAKPDAQ